MRIKATFKTNNQKIKATFGEKVVVVTADDVLENIIAEQKETIDTLTELNNEYKTELEDTAQAMSNVGVEDVTVDNTADKVPEVFEAGEKSQHSAFWDDFQNNGKRTYYDEAYYGDGWTINNFEPIHDMAPVSAYGMFSYNRMVCELDTLLNELNVQLDFSKCKNMPSVFYTTDFLQVGKVDTASLNTSSWNMFARSFRLHTIKELVLYPDTEKYINFSNAFSGTTALVNIKITGTGRITQNINLGDCVSLSEISIINFINYLSDEVTGKTITFSRSAVIDAFGSLSDTSWKYLVNKKPNWLIALV